MCMSQVLMRSEHIRCARLESTGTSQKGNEVFIKRKKQARGICNRTLLGSVQNEHFKSAHVLKLL